MSDHQNLSLLPFEDRIYRSPTFTAPLYMSLLRGVESDIRISIMETNFSQIRGTLQKMLGETSLRFCARVSMLSTKLTVPPAHTA